MASTAGTKPATTSEQPTRSPAKARKYNFGKPGGPRKSRRNSLGQVTEAGRSLLRCCRQVSTLQEALTVPQWWRHERKRFATQMPSQSVVR